MIGRTLRGALCLAVGWPTSGAAQQYLAAPGSVAAGAEVRLYDFGPHLGVRRLWQMAAPVALTLPWGRFSLDGGTWYATTTLERRDGSTATVDGVTDVQVRASYVIGDDAVVITGVANLPTGLERLSATEYGVLAATSSGFLAFPVNSFTTGLSLTTGIAGAVVAGQWNLGLAGSVRLSREFAPFVDDKGVPFTYQSGPEVRVRGGADRIAGDGRLALALTYSTFSTDEYGTGGNGFGRYRPGQRTIAEAFYVAPLGTTTLTTYVWNFYRTAGDSLGKSVGNRENLLAGGLLAAIPLSASVTFEPGAEGRWSKPEVGQAFLVEFGAALRARVLRSATLMATARTVFGRLEEPEPGIGHAIRGGSVSLFLRQSF